MNEQIGKLINRSGGEFYEGFLGIPNTIKFTEEELKTFVELIVKEFSEQVQLAGRFGLEQEQILIRICCKKAKQHFGVEE